MKIKLTKPQKQNLKRVAATLKHGRILGAGGVAILWLGVLLCALATLGFQLLSFRRPIFMPLSYVWVFLGALIFMYILSQGIAKDDIRKWLQDAVEISAYCMRVCKESSDKRLKTVVRIQLTFIYEGEEKCLVSGDSPIVKLDTSKQIGTRRVFSRYLNQNVTILYSPTHNQAMLLKLPKD